jgi:signal transduction histidine kinase
VPARTDPDPSAVIAALQERIRLQEQALHARSRELEVYQRVQQAINRQLDLENVLQMIADHARALTGCRSSTVYLLENPAGHEEPFLRLAVISGALRSAIQPGYHLPLSGSVAGLAIRDRRPYCVQDAWGDPRVFRDAVQRSDVTSFLIVPLLSGEDAVGIISVANKQDGALDDEDERILTLLASSAVISMENARLYAQAGEIAVLNERNRLARELHDAVTQSLFSASLIGDVLPTLWEEDPAEGKRRLEELRGLTRGSMSEMRMLLLELRPTSLEKANLQELLRHLVNAAAGRSHIAAQLRCDCDSESLAALPPVVKTTIYRIAQEAVNNVIKHAAAENVLLLFHCQPQATRLEIIDDGIGFQPHALMGGHFGLENMRERAQLIAADLEVASQPGEGTQITLSWRPEQGAP